MGARLGSHGLGNGAHAAARMAPDAPLTIDLPERMVQQHIGAARRIRAGIVADHCVKAVQRLQRIALEPVVEDGSGAAGE